MSKKLDGISLVIIGSQTRPTVMPEIEWVQEIVEACDKAGIPVFLKNNLKPLIDKVPDEIFPLFVNDEGQLRQEMPQED